MWGEPGFAYVYLIYGFYYCFNTVCRPSGEAEAVLVRAVEAHWAEDWMRIHRPVEKETQLTSGPGKLCVAMQILREHDGVDLCASDSPVMVAENPEVKKFRRAKGPMITTTRIGINVGVEMPLRFYLHKSAFISRKVRVARGK